jgi:hypothetical protein
VRVAVYTCITNNYDQLKGIDFPLEFDLFCFSDTEQREDIGWKIIKIESGEFSHKHVKCNVHKLIPDYDYYIYIDGSFQLKKGIKLLFSQKKHFELVCVVHPSRRSCFSETNHCFNVGKINSSEAALCQDFLSGYKDKRLYEMGFFIRKNTEPVNSLFEEWFNNILNVCKRDQITFPRTLDKYRSLIKFNDITTSRRFESAQLFKHNSLNETKIIYSTPFSSEKLVGKEYNRICEKASKGEWICLRDADTMFLRSDFGSIIENTIRENPNIDLFGCYTNRIGLNYQLYNGIMSENPDITYHKKIADKAFQEHRYSCTIINKPIAGLFLLFKKELWDEIKFCDGMFNNSNELFDWDFSKKVLESGKTIGLINGLYLFHYYRFIEGGKKYINHLL